MDPNENTEEFDINIEGDDDVDVEIVDTAPPEDRGKALLPPDKEAPVEADDDEEIASYSEKVQKRIKDATFRFHDQRRKREQAEREREEAVKFAQAALQRAQQLEATAYQYEAGFVDQAKTRVEAELAQAKADMKAAYDIGDADKMAEAQTKLARLSVQQDQYSRFQPRQAPEPQVYTGPQDTNPRPAPDDAEKFVAWREKNTWFEQDETLRDFAMGVHTRIATSSPEVVGSDEYYADIEKQVKAAFPHKFETVKPRTQNTRTAPVAGVTRASGAEKARKTITLTRDQMALCRRLGITPVAYARELEKNGE